MPGCYCEIALGCCFAVLKPSHLNHLTTLFTQWGVKQAFYFKQFVTQKKKGEITRGQTKLNHEEIHNLQSSPNHGDYVTGKWEKRNTSTRTRDEKHIQNCHQEKISKSACCVAHSVRVLSFWTPRYKHGGRNFICVSTEEFVAKLRVI